MRPFESFGNKLRIYRQRNRKNITSASKALKIDRTHLSKLENGHERPSQKVMLAIVSHYSLSVAETAELWALAGYQHGWGGTQQGKGVTGMDLNGIGTANKPPQGATQLQINTPADKPILYCDSVFVSSNQFGVVMDFVQAGFGATTTANKQQLNVVSRVGMSREHAKVMLETLLKNLEMSAEAESIAKKGNIKN